MKFYSQGIPNITGELPLVILTALLLLLGGCTTNPTKDQAPIAVAEDQEIDPYEDFNRDMYEFNDSVDNYIAEPISDAYKFVTPNILQTGVSNFFSNLGNVGVVFNDVLQGKVQQGAEDTGRFLINSTVGVLGLFDVASEVGLEQNQEDFGQTLAVWGVPTGPYMVLPFLGPTTFRGLPGTAVDIATNPITYIGIPALAAASVVNTRANADGALQFVDEAALDPYIFTREAYLQWRKHLASDGNPDTDEDPLADYEDELFEEEDEEQLYDVKINTMLDGGTDSNEQASTQLQSGMKEDPLNLAPTQTYEFTVPATTINTEQPSTEINLNNIEASDTSFTNPINIEHPEQY